MQTVTVRDFSIRSLPLGTSQRLRLELFSLLSGSVTIPAVVARGNEDGPTLFAVAGVHGNEYEGMEAIRQVFASLNPVEMRGMFVGLPIANPFAYESRTRVAPLHIDGLNLARVFPGAAAGSPSQILAHILLGLVVANFRERDLFIDLHSGSAQVQYAPLIGFRDVPGIARDRAEEAARHFGFSRLWRIPDSAGPFNAETARRGITTLGTETTGRAGCNPADVAGLVRGLANLLAYMDIQRDTDKPERYNEPARSTIDVLSPATGFLRSERTIDDEIAAGERLASVIDVFGDIVGVINAPRAGTIWAARSMPAIRTGEVAYVIAEAASTTEGEPLRSSSQA